MARAEGGTFLLRIEDIDQSRARPEWEALIYEDLHWLGLSWEEPVMRQSDRFSVYRRTLGDLWDRNLVFGCSCNRRDILAAASAPHEGEPPMGPDGIVYPGTCRGQCASPNPPEPPVDRTLRLESRKLALTKAFEPRVAEGAFFKEEGQGPNGESGLIEFGPAEFEARIGDIVLARRDMATSYHLSVVVDDAEQEITHVVRGADLFDATKIHVVLQRLLGLPTPIYHHHRLIRDDQGKRLAKRDDARALRTYREDGATPADIRQMLGLAAFPSVQKYPRG